MQIQAAYATPVPRVVFTQNLDRHVPVRPLDVGGTTVQAALDAAFAELPRLKGYVVDDQGALRKHVVVFVDGVAIADRRKLTDPVRPDSEVYVMQALSGG
jgi:hypothetical protein